EIAYAAAILNQCCAFRAAKSFFNSIGHKRTFRNAIAMSALPPKADIICGRALSASRQQVQETLTVFLAGYRRQTSSRSEVGYRKARSFHSPTKTLLSVLTVAGMARAQYTVSSRNSYRPTDL